MGVNKNSLAKQLSWILGLPINNREGKAFDIVNAITQTMTDALLRGEKIHINGFGSFCIRTRPAVYKSFLYFPSMICSRGYKRIPPKKYVHFVPSDSLLRFINGSNQRASQKNT